MVVKFLNETITARFTYNGINENMVVGENFENKVASYLKRMELKPKVIKNYLINNGVYLFFIEDKKKEKNNKQSIVVRCGELDTVDVRILRSGNNIIFGDDGTDIICNWNGYFVLVQCKYRTPCDGCKMLEDRCKHVYSKRNMMKDVKKLDEKINEYKKGSVFGIFIVNDEIDVEKIEEDDLSNMIMVTNFTRNLFKEINETGHRFVIKIEKEIMLKKNKSLNSEYIDFEYTSDETDMICEKFENLMKNVLENFSYNFFEVVKLVLKFIRENSNNRANDMKNIIKEFKDLNV
jgi:hypothetical protein